MSQLAIEVTAIVEEIMKEKHISRAELANMMDVSKSNITRLLSGERNMRLSTVENLAKILGHDVVIGFVPKHSKMPQARERRSHEYAS